MIIPAYSIWFLFGNKRWGSQIKGSTDKKIRNKMRPVFGEDG